MNAKSRQANVSPLKSVTSAMLSRVQVDQLGEIGLRVQLILLDQVRPNPVQPRRVFPEPFYQRFNSSNLTPSQVLREFIEYVKSVARKNGRPFTNPSDLLDDPDKDVVNDHTEWTPEEIVLYDLTVLAMTIRDDGQVNPLTVVDITKGVVPAFEIETGERRFWATCLLRDFIPGYESDGTIPCIVVPAERASVFRQARENTARTGLSAVAMARQAALLLLYVHDYEIPNSVVTYDFYRQALELDLRKKREHMGDVLSAMGGIDKARFSQYKALLQLSDDALELADRHNIDEFRLRWLLKLPKEDQLHMVEQIITRHLTGRQIQDILDPAQENETSADSENVLKEVKRFLKSIKILTGSHQGEFVRRLMIEEENPKTAIALIESTINFLIQAKNQMPKE